MQSRQYTVRHQKQSGLHADSENNISYCAASTLASE